MTPGEMSTRENLDIMYNYKEQLKANLNKEELTELLKHNNQLVPFKIEEVFCY